MKSLHPFSDDVSGLAAQTIEARAHRFSVVPSGFREWNTTSVPAKGLIGYPSSFSTRRSDPYSGLAATMHDRQSPLGLEISHFAVRDQFSAQRIDDFNRHVAKDELGSNPDQVSSTGKNDAQEEFDGLLHEIGNKQEAIGSKENDQNERNTSPYVIALGTKDLVHRTSIPGERK